MYLDSGRDVVLFLSCRWAEPGLTVKILLFRGVRLREVQFTLPLVVEGPRVSTLKS